MSSERQTKPLFPRLRQPEYTGKNRCSVCTLLNSIIAAILVIAVAVFSTVGAAVVLLVAVVSIVFRGYLIPGTPTLVQYLPDAVHDAIGASHPVDASPDVRHDHQDTTLETLLLDANVIEEVSPESDLRFTGSYEQVFQDRLNELDSVRARRAQLANVLAVESDRIAFDGDQDQWYVTVDDEQAGSWSSEAAFLADLVNRELLASFVPDWHDLPNGDRTRLIAVLRAFVETCPTCGGDVVPNESVTQSCCRGEFVSVKTACTDCSKTLFEGTER